MSTLAASLAAAKGCSSLFLSSAGAAAAAAPVLSLLSRGGIAPASTPRHLPWSGSVRSASSLSGGSTTDAATPTPGQQASRGHAAPAATQHLFAARSTPATTLRSFAAQPALAEEGQMFCVSCLFVAA